MPHIKVHEKEFMPYISSDEIEKQVRRVADEITRDYAGKKPLFVAILNGAFIFAADLFKYLQMEVDMGFIKLSSYESVKTRGKLITAIGLDAELYGRDVILVADIVDTGKTLTHFLPHLEHQHPASLKIVSLLHKPSASIFPVQIDYLGFTIPDKFVIGYGLDYDGLGRNIKEIYQQV